MGSSIRDSTTKQQTSPLFCRNLLVHKLVMQFTRLVDATIESLETCGDATEEVREWS